MALARNDSEAIARGATHQAELCRQWGRLECELRREALPRSLARPAGAPGNSIKREHVAQLQTELQEELQAQLQAEWQTLEARIRYLTRVHTSLLRHLQRSLAILHRVVDVCAPAYKLDPNPLLTDVRLGAVK